MTALLAFFQTPLGQFVLLCLGYGLREGIAAMIKQKRNAALTGVAQAAADVITSGLAAKDPQAAIAAAKSAILTDMPNVAKSLEAGTVEVLLAGHVAQAVTAPGGATVTLPGIGGTP